MKVKNQISPAIISATVAMLSPYVPDISPTNLIAALQNYGTQEIKDDGRPQRPYTVNEVCKTLGITKPTVYRMFEDGSLTKLKIRGATRIPAEDILKILSGNSAEK